MRDECRVVERSRPVRLVAAECAGPVGFGRIAAMTDSAAGALPDDSRVASALGATWALLAETLQQGWASRDDGIYTLVTGVPIASLNGVWVVGENVDADTPGPHRRRGYGAAITAHAALDARAAGAKWAWLQSTEAGHRVYERLGFTTLERWPVWSSPL
jgi:GNAT superfamily N-acetyltransferase